MGKYNIPKLARNKYNYVEGADTTNFITQSQLMTQNGGAGNGNINSNSFQSNSQLQSAIKSMIDEMIASYELVGSSYVIAVAEEVQRNCYTYTDSKVSSS